ncbi:MAG: ABC transporter ATP-binding protein [Oligoflexia bacterium]|nr:ABC transporter ATP-binding protein [Oligoflexia bacterium]
MTESLITLQAVEKVFAARDGRTVTALDRLDLEIGAGDFVAIVGASGSGKSTLLFTIGGLLEPSAGKVIVAGTPVYGLSPGERALLRQKRIGFMFQTFNLLPYLSCLENVMVAPLLAGSTRAEAKTQATAILERLGLAHRLAHRPGELSVGERQRVALARSVVNKPDVLLADEPTGNLDPAMTEEIVGLLQELNMAGQTILMVTHDHRLAVRSKRVITLAKGRLA